MNAIIKVQGDYESSAFVELSNSSLYPDVNWASYGHPTTIDGQKVGEPLHGTIQHEIIMHEETIHDFNLYVMGFSPNAKYEGFSGSAVIDSNGRVVSILRYRGHSYLSSVSVRKAMPFFEKHKLKILPDNLEKFDEYMPSMFNAFEQNIKSICIPKAKLAIADETPNSIIKSKRGELFFPNKVGEIPNLIAELKKNPEKNTALWKGWIEFLTYVAFLREEKTEINAITITLSDVQLKKILFFKSIQVKTIEVKLIFLFTDENQYIQIGSDYIKDNITKGKLESNTCHIFNALNPQFGLASLSNHQKKKVVEDIADPKSGTPRVLGKIDFGMLSLIELTQEVAKSTTLREASANLENLFKNAIK